jgi:hypothetical protein
MTGGEERDRAPWEATVGERTEHVICMVAAAALVIALALGIATR